MHRSKGHRYSITSSARASNIAGTPSPIAFAALRLITSSNPALRYYNIRCLPTSEMGPNPDLSASAPMSPSASCGHDTALARGSNVPECDISPPSTSPRD